MSGAQQSRQTTLVSIHAPSNRFRRCHLSLQSPASPFPHGTCLLLVSTTDTALHIDFKTMYGERPNPDFSRLRAIMSFAEHDKLMAWFGKMHAAGCTGCVPMFDGVLFNTDTLRMEMKVARTIESVCGETGFVFEVKQWPAGASKNRLPSGVLQDCPLQVFDAEVHPVGHLHCVLSGVSFIIGGFTMCVGEDGERPSLTVQDLNTFELHSSQRDPVRISQLEHMGRFHTVVPACGVCYILHAPLPHNAEGCAETGNLMVGRLCLGGTVVLFDDPADRRLLRVPTQEFRQARSAHGAHHAVRVEQRGPRWHRGGGARCAPTAGRRDRAPL